MTFEEYCKQNDKTLFGMPPEEVAPSLCAVVDGYVESRISKLLDRLTTHTSGETWRFSPDLDSSVDFAWSYVDSFTLDEAGNKNAVSGSTQKELLEFIGFYKLDDEIYIASDTIMETGDTE